MIVQMDNVSYWMIWRYPQPLGNHNSYVCPQMVPNPTKGSVEKVEPINSLGLYTTHHGFHGNGMGNKRLPILAYEQFRAMNIGGTHEFFRQEFIPVLLMFMAISPI